ncbi:unnamed protein product [Bathycoccus prasinos]
MSQSFPFSGVPAGFRVRSKSFAVYIDIMMSKACQSYDFVHARGQFHRLYVRQSIVNIAAYNQ